MSKRTSDGAAKVGNTKKTRPPTWTQSIDTAIESADLTGCKQIQNKLENLLHLTKQRIAKLEVNAKQQGLNYKGEDKIECGCGNTFESGGEYAAYCDVCEAKEGTEQNEQCTDCIKECNADCGNRLCKECRQECSGCSPDFFCEDCTVECNCCNERFCDRSKECTLVGFGYGDEMACIYCLER